MSSASNRRLLDRTEIRRRLRGPAARLRRSALPIVQCALAAGLAWWVATGPVGHERPFFAPIAAVVSLGLSLGARLRRSVELVCGVTIGIGVGDLIISMIGSGPWQIALVVVMAMSTAVLINGGVIFAMQAGNSAVLVATLIPPGGTGGIDRMVDALVGGLVGIAVVAMVPTHPVRRARRDAAGILATARVPGWPFCASHVAGKVVVVTRARSPTVAAAMLRTPTLPPSALRCTSASGGTASLTLRLLM